MNRVLFTPAAKRDLESIRDFSFENWGAEKAEDYLRRIFHSARELAERPNLGRSRDDVLPGYRSRRVGSHAIFFKVLDGGIEVIRILHQRMDVDDL